MKNDGMKMSLRHDHVFAIVRVDTDAGGEVPWHVKVTVKRIVTDPDHAEAEVKRLNDLNAGKGCHYFSQVTRIEKGAMAAIAVGELASSATQDRP